MGKNKKLFILVVGVFVASIVGVGFLIKTGLERGVWEQIEAVFPDRGIPRINIKLDGVSLEEIDKGPKDIKYDGNALDLYDERTTSSFANVEIKGRGNGTWVQEKKPYQIRFENKEDLLGMGAARKWYLLANAMDGANIRTEVAFYLEHMLGMKYAFDGDFVELYVDDEYRGLYYLTHAVEIDKMSVDLKNPDGVLVELDNLYWYEEEAHYETGNGDVLVMKDVVSKDNMEVAAADFLEKYNAFERAVADGDYDEVAKLVDVKSFAQYYLLSEFSVNPDAYWTSFYMYKDGPDDLIHAGPGWDFDLAFGNRSWGNWMGEDFYSPARTMARKDELMTREMYEERGLLKEGEMDWHGLSLRLSQIIFDLMDMPEFQDEVKRIYNERMRGRDGELLWKISTTSKKIEWNSFVDDDKWKEKRSEGEVEVMKKWIIDRYDYLDKLFDDETLKRAPAT